MSTDEKTALEIERAAFDAKAEAENKTRSGKGLRLRSASTRGKNTMNITFEAWDTSKKDTLPGTVAEFIQLSGVSDEAELVARLIEGDNDFRYSNASDPISEHVSPSWPDELAVAFKGVVRGLLKAGLSLEQAVGKVKPGFDIAASALSA